MNGVPSQGVMLSILSVGLQCRGRDSTAADEHCDGEDDDEHWQQHDEGERAEDKAQRDGFPAELLQMEPDGWGAMLAAFHKNVLLTEPDEQRAQGLAERPEEGGLHAPELPDAVEIAGDETRFGVVSGGGLLKRGRLSSLRCRDRVHRMEWFPISITDDPPTILTQTLQDSTAPAMHGACATSGAEVTADRVRILQALGAVYAEHAKRTLCA